MKTILLVIALSVVLCGQPPTEEQRTGDLFNGRFWNSQTQAMKESFVQGYATGSYDAALLIFARAKVDGTPMLKELFPSGMTPKEVSLAMDRFYATPENIRIVVNAAIKIVAMRVAGADEAKIQKATADARSSAGK